MARHETEPMRAETTPEIPEPSTTRDWTNVGQLERIASALAGGALAAYGISRKNPSGLALALLGGTVLFRGATGHCPIYGAIGASTALEKIDIHLEDGVIIDKPRAQLFDFWRDFSNLPLVVPELESVTPINGSQMRWIASRPGRMPVMWETEIIAEKKNALITWQTMSDARNPHTVSVRFVTLPQGGTEVRLSLEYSSPGGKISGDLARIITRHPEQLLTETLHRFRDHMESRRPASEE